MIFDLSTILAALGGTSFILSLSFLLIWRMDTEKAGPILWFIGFLCLASSFFLFSAQQWLIPFFSEVLPSILCLSGLALSLYAQRRFLGISFIPWFDIGILSAFLIFFISQTMSPKPGLFMWVSIGSAYFLIRGSFLKAKDNSGEPVLFKRFSSASGLLLWGLCVLHVMYSLHFVMLSPSVESWLYSFYFFALFLFGGAWGLGLILMIPQQIAVELKVAELELRRLISIDPLTGAYNRRYFFEVAAKELSRVQRYKSSASVMLLDVDHFKVINDTYGHASGDIALKKVTLLCLSRLRKVDIFARIGGEEFAFFLPETDLDGAHQLAERIRSLFERMEMRLDTESVRLTTSIGVSSVSEHDKNIESVVQRADGALYKAKENGRNQTICAEFDGNAFGEEFPPRAPTPTAAY